MSLSSKMTVFKITSYVAFCLVLILGIHTCFAQEVEKKDTILIGEISKRDLESNFKWFNERYQKYIPNDSAIKALMPLASKLSFVLVIGTWCSDSKEHVPPFYKVMDVLGVKKGNVKMYAVNRKKDRQLTPELKKLNFEFVPTFIVYKNKKEEGRIVEDTKISIEKDLVEILLK